MLRVLGQLASEIRGDMRQSELLRLVGAASSEWARHRLSANESIVAIVRVRHAIQKTTIPTVVQGQKTVK